MSCNLHQPLLSSVNQRDSEGSGKNSSPEAQRQCLIKGIIGWEPITALDVRSQKVHVLHPTRVSSFTDVTAHRDENNHYRLTISTMADSGPPGAGNLPLDICVESPHQDGLNDTMEVTEEAELMDFDSMEGGGFVAVSPTHHFTLFHLSSGLDKDVYYVVDANYSKSSNSS
jgi:hypothetical protein